MPRSVHVTGGIAQRVNPELVIPAKHRVFIELSYKINQPEYGRRLIAVEPRKDRDLDAWFHHLRALEDEPGQPEAVFAAPPETQGIGAQKVGSTDLHEEG